MRLRVRGREMMFAVKTLLPVADEEGSVCVRHAWERVVEVVGIKPRRS